MAGEQLGNVGAWCSIVGLLISFAGLLMAAWAALSARGARDAVLAARRAVQQERGRDELLDVLQDVGRLTAAIRADDSSTARLLAARLSERYHVWQVRSALALGLTTQASLGRLQIGLRRLADSVGAGAPPTEEHARLAEQCAAYVAKLAATVQRDVDRETQKEN